MRKLASGKHSSLLAKAADKGSVKFYVIGRGKEGKHSSLLTKAADKVIVKFYVIGRGKETNKFPFFCLFLSFLSLSLILKATTATKRCHDTQHNDTQHDDTQHDDI